LSIQQEKILYIFAIIFLVVSPFLATNSIGSPSTIQNTLSDIDSLPTATITIDIRGLFLGNHITAQLEFGFIYDDDLRTYAIGFQQIPLVIDNSVIFSRVVGLGYAEMREYPFVYSTSGGFYDYWTNHSPEYSSRRFYAAWTETRYTALYLGPLTEENITNLAYAGDVVEFENLTLYFDDGSSFLCGPQIITTGVNFTHQENMWNADFILGCSSEVGVTIEETRISLQNQIPDPISLPFLGLCGGIAAVVILYWAYRRFDFTWTRKKSYVIDPV
jgi:hypothetical protein